MRFFFLLEMLTKIFLQIFVDLDKLQVRLSPSGAPIVPFGLDKDDVNLASRRSGASNGPDEPRPWADVCTPFSKDMILAYANRDPDLLQASIRALVSILVDGSHLDDLCVRNFHGMYFRTQLSTLLQPETPTVGNRGYVALRVQLASNLAQGSARDRHLCMESRNFVDMLTSGNSTLKRGPETTRVLGEVAKRSFDCQSYLDASEVLLNSRLADSAGRNWKFGFRVMAVYDFLARAGCEVSLASCWDNLALIFAQTRFSALGVVGVPSRVTLLMRKRALQLYSLLVDLSELRWARSAKGHLMMLKAERSKMQQSVSRMPIGREPLASLMARAKPASIESIAGNDSAAFNPFVDVDVAVSMDLLNFADTPPTPVVASTLDIWSSGDQSTPMSSSAGQEDLWSQPVPSSGFQASSAGDDWFADSSKAGAVSAPPPTRPNLPPR